MVTLIEFSDPVDLENVVKALPLPEFKKIKVLDGKTIIDHSDQSGAPGAGKTTHSFSILGMEKE